ncbi:TPA: SP_1767 family glycosyltransferase [Streptococcus suis]
MKKIICLAGDKEYLLQLTTCLKSIFRFNRQCRIYIFNQDIPQEWFVSIRKIASQFDSQIHDIRLFDSELAQNWSTHDHINHMTYARYFIPKYIPEDRVLYLDSDTLVCQSLDSLYSLDLEGYPLAAILDPSGIEFNAGVLVIDNKKWRKEQILDQLIQTTQSEQAKKEADPDYLFNGDQTVFNKVFANNWLELDKRENLQVGHDMVAFYSHWSNHFNLSTEYPRIIHFTTRHKPWNTYSSHRYRDLWWTFAMTDWSNLTSIELEDFQQLQTNFNAFTFTNSESLEQIETLVQACPDITFHIAAYTNMGLPLLKLNVYDNVRLYQSIVGPILDRLIEDCQIYLDINYGNKQLDIIQKIKERNTPMLAFTTTTSPDTPATVYALDRVDQMIESLKHLQTSQKETPVKKTIVLAANYAYNTQVLTTIKSICYHNRNVTFYLINSDFPSEWFTGLNKKLAPLDSKIINGRVNSQILEGYQTNISYTVFLRYFIPQLVTEDRVLYLDCDLVVSQDLTPLFTMDMQGYPLAAVKDLGGQVYFNEHVFNSGVLLIDNKQWKEENMTKHLIEMTNEWHDKVIQDDQSILNMVFKDRWLALENTYNFVTIHQMFSDYPLDYPTYPAIIHYLTERKPWSIYTQSLFRDLWWFYHDLEWTDIQKQDPLPRMEKLQVEKPKPTAFIYTYSEGLEGIEFLLENLPQWTFIIASPVMVSDRLASLLRYDNLVLASNLIGLSCVVDDLVQQSSVLLDINYDGEVESIIERFNALNKPVYSLPQTQHGQQGQVTFSQVQEMALALERLATKEYGETTTNHPTVLGISETIDYLLRHQSSLARFGDGEMDIIAGNNIPYQDYHPQLAEELKHILSLDSQPNFMVCLSDVFDHLERYNQAARDFWIGHLDYYKSYYQDICQADWYGSTFISRPYMDLIDKEPSSHYFKQLKKIWQDKDILIVEGEFSRSGVGNDLFQEATSIQRIICPSRNAYEHLEAIKQAIREHGKDKLILVMLGPTAKVLAYQLSQEGYQIIDIGHIDSEYEWYRLQATEKIKFSHKHTAEHNFDQDILSIEDTSYTSQIILKISER